MVQSQVDIAQSLGLNPLGRVHHKYRPVTGGERSGDFIIKIHMARGIDQVEDIFLPASAVVNNPYGLRLDCDASLPFYIHIVKDLVLHLPAGKQTCLFDDPVRQRRLPVVNMRDNAEIADPAFLNPSQTRSS